MRTAISAVLLIFSWVYAFPAASYSLDTTDKKIEDAAKSLDILGDLIRPVKKSLAEKKFDLDLLFTDTQGFDNNIFLDAPRKYDTYNQQTLSEYLVYKYSNDLRLNFDTDIYNSAYFRHNDNNILEITVEPGIDIDFLDDKLTLEVDYALDWTYFPYDEDGTYLLNRFSLFARNNVWKKFYQKIGGRIEFKNYEDRITYGPAAMRDDDLQADKRYTGEYEAGLTLTDNIRLKENLRFYRNDSNNQFQDYYDYWAFSARTSAVVYFTKKFYAITSFSFINKAYDDRLSTKNNSHQVDNTYFLSANIIYRLTRYTSVNAGYFYRENATNEPLDKYAGHVFTVGIYYFF